MEGKGRWGIGCQFIFHLSFLIFIDHFSGILIRSTKCDLLSPPTERPRNHHEPSLMPTALIQFPKIPDIWPCETAAIGLIKKCDDLGTLLELRKHLLGEG